MKKIKHRLSRLEKLLVDVTPDPILSWLEGLNDWMIGCVKMFGSVLVLGRVAAAHMSTYETEAQVDPCISRFQTVLASISARGDFMYLIEMCTALCHALSSFFVYRY